MALNGKVVHTTPVIKDVKEGDNPYWYLYDDTFLLPYNSGDDCVTWTWYRQGTIWDTKIHTTDPYSVSYLKWSNSVPSDFRRVAPENPNVKDGLGQPNKKTYDSQHYKKESTNYSTGKTSINDVMVELYSVCENTPGWSTTSNSNPS